ncbi:MAG: cytochrome c biogenesis protein ResB [Verrucomicrobia bacterium]|nr:cytochrome c biogenesis protein ResB [Kiritimatiellia bacterium]MCO6400047.1 cytochrome c biogenesis protein ResB [Verrucomicrobiota bacterium]
MNDETHKTSRAAAIWAYLGSAQITTYGLAFLMVLTFWGTLYQVQNGLYLAKERFFDSWFFLAAGVVPFPGTQLVLAVLMLNLVVYLIRLLARKKLTFGLLVIHLGLLLMLGGGAITHLFARESQLTLAEGESGSASASYGDWEVAVWSREGDMLDVMAYNSNALKAGDVLRFEDAGLTLRVEEYYRNARAFQSTTPLTNAPLSSHNLSSLRSTKLAKEPGENIAGAVITIEQQDGAPARAILFGEDEVPTTFAHDGKDYTIALRRMRDPLPFVVTLQDFRKEMHPGTGIARHFSSRVTVSSDGVERDMVISMNKPLRDRGFTLYQASYREEPGSDAQWSTFAVMHNYGRMIPYIATGMVSFGLAWHFIVMMVRRARRSGGASA